MASKNLYASLFGETPETQKAYLERNAAFQDMLNTRRQAAQQNRTDSARMAKYNALGNLLTTMVQPVGWAIGGKSAGAAGGFQPYDNRQYLEAFNRAVKAADDIRNIGTAEGEYRFKLADEDYRRQQAIGDAASNRIFALEDEARKRQQGIEDDARKSALRIAEQNAKFEHDMEKQERQAELKMQLAAYNAAHRIKSRTTGESPDWRTQQKLIQGYLDESLAMQARGEQPPTYPDWVRSKGFTFSTTTPTPPPKDPPKDPKDGVDIGIK